MTIKLDLIRQLPEIEPQVAEEAEGSECGEGLDDAIFISACILQKGYAIFRLPTSWGSTVTLTALTPVC